MARAATATLDGLVVGYGVRNSLNPEAGNVHTMGHLAQVQVNIDYTNITSFATATAATVKHFQIPAGSVIRSANLVVLTGFGALTSILVGTKKLDGTEIDANGLLDTCVLASIDAAGETVEGAGAQINGPALAYDAYVSVDVTGSAATLGHAVLTIVYEQEVPSQVAPAVITGEI